LTTSTFVKWSKLLWSKWPHFCTHRVVQINPHCHLDIVFFVKICPKLDPKSVIQFFDSTSFIITFPDVMGYLDSSSFQDQKQYGEVLKIIFYLSL